jgi:hypothetical protein
MAKKQSPAIKITQEEIGDSGTQIFGGYVRTGEYNPDLAGTRGLRVWDEMRLGNTTVQSTLWGFKLPIVQANWSLENDDDSDQQVKVVSFLEHNLFDRLQWPTVVEDSLTHLDMGFYVAELVFEPITWERQTRIGISKVAFRKQTSIQKWEAADGKPGITQTKADGTQVGIPQIKLVHIANRQEGDNPYGVSILRSAWQNWRYIQAFYRFESIGYERQSVGIPIAAYPPGTGKGELAKLENLLRNLRTNEQAYLTFPAGTEVGFMDMKGHTVRNPREAIEHHDRELSEALLMSMMKLGGAHGTGSQSLSSDISRLTALAQQAVADKIAQAFTETLIKVLVELNFTGAAIPQLRCNDITDTDIPMMSTAVKTYVEAGALKPRPEDENLVRRQIGWHELSDEEVEERKVEVDDKTDDTKPDEATVTELKAMRASVEKALYADTSRAA